MGNKGNKKAPGIFYQNDRGFLFYNKIRLVITFGDIYTTYFDGLNLEQSFQYH